MQKISSGWKNVMTILKGNWCKWSQNFKHWQPLSIDNYRHSRIERISWSDIKVWDFIIIIIFLGVCLYELKASLKGNKQSYDQYHTHLAAWTILWSSTHNITKTVEWTIQSSDHLRCLRKSLAKLYYVTIMINKIYFNIYYVLALSCLWIFIYLSLLCVSYTRLSHVFLPNSRRKMTSNTIQHQTLSSNWQTPSNFVQRS